MRTRSSLEYTIPKRRNCRRSRHRQEAIPLILDPIPMADDRPMAEQLQAPTGGFESAIVVPIINAQNFELKSSLINLVQNLIFRGGNDEEPHAHIRHFESITNNQRPFLRTARVLIDVHGEELVIRDDALILMPKYQKMLKSLLSNKEKLNEMAKTPMNANCSAVILKKLPEKLGDPGVGFIILVILWGFDQSLGSSGSRCKYKSHALVYLEETWTS
ncbi:hypothetical protein Tco_0927278 [Tanacetum coccineum]